MKSAPRIQESVRGVANLDTRSALDPSIAEYPLIEQLAALRAICQVFIRQRSRLCIAQADTWGRSIIDSMGAVESQALEYMNVHQRSVLIPAAHELLRDFPEKLLKFFDAAGISRWHFNGSTHLHPSWFDAVLNARLARQNRWVREEHVRELVATARATGQRLTKAAIRRQLKWQGDIPLDWLASGESPAGHGES